MNNPIQKDVDARISKIAGNLLQHVEALALACEVDGYRDSIDRTEFFKGEEYSFGLAVQEEHDSAAMDKTNKT